MPCYPSLSDSIFKQQIWVRILTARLRLSFELTSSLERKEGAGKAGCPSAPAASRAKVKSTRVSHHRRAETIRPSLRDWF
jgi:hypothetical protein